MLAAVTCCYEKKKRYKKKISPELGRVRNQWVWKEKKAPLCPVCSISMALHSCGLSTSPPASVAMCPPCLCCCLLSLFAMLSIDPSCSCCCQLSPTFALWHIILPLIMLLHELAPPICIVCHFPSFVLLWVSPSFSCCHFAIHQPSHSFVIPSTCCCSLSAPCIVVCHQVVLFSSTSTDPYEQWLTGGWRCYGVVLGVARNKTHCYPASSSLQWQQQLGIIKRRTEPERKGKIVSRSNDKSI